MDTWQANCLTNWNHTTTARHLESGNSRMACCIFKLNQTIAARQLESLYTQQTNLLGNRNHTIAVKQLEYMHTRHANWFANSYHTTTANNLNLWIIDRPVWCSQFSNYCCKTNGNEDTQQDSLLSKIYYTTTVRQLESVNARLASWLGKVITLLLQDKLKLWILSRQVCLLRPSQFCCMTTWICW